jgi:hypothetical protein
MLRPVSHPVVRSDGYSFFELLVTMCVLSIVGGMGAMSFSGLIASSRADSVAYQVASILRYGRDAAVAQRRMIELDFTAPNQIRLLRRDGAQVAVVAMATLEHGGQFEVADGLPDTPDAFGRGSAIDFDNSAVVRFVPDGTVTDAAGIPVNGTVFVALPRDPLSARAITLTGTTTRAQAYRWSGRRWEAM